MAGTIIQLDPRKVRFGTNVRTIDKSDPDFVASIASVGVLQPPTIVDDGDGGYDLVIGQRRTRAAIDAGLEAVDFYLVPAHEADAARLLEQLAENEQREGLTNSERAAGYQQLSLFGFTADEIVERTRAPRKTVDAALAIAGHNAATVVAEHQIDLEQAAQMVEFESDKKATAELIRIATTYPDAFDRTLAEFRRKRDLAASKKAANDKLKADGTAKAKPGDYSYYYYSSTPRPGERLTKLRGPDGKEISPARHKDCPGHAAFVDGGGQYSSKAEIIYVCTDWAANGHTNPSAQKGAKPVSKAEAARLAREDKARAEAEAARELARELRTKFVQELLQRNKPDTLPGAPRLIATAIMSSLADLRWNVRDAGLVHALTFLQLPTEDLTIEKGWALLTREAENPKQAGTVALAEALGLFEHSARSYLNEHHKLYFDALVAWGHNLTDIERESIASRDAALESQRLDREERAAAAAAAETAEQDVDQDEAGE